MRKFLVLLYCFACQVIYAQHHYQKWMFGDNSGLDFSTNPPSPIKLTNMVAGISTIWSAVCDKNGNLVFYTDGIAVYNAKKEQVSPYKSMWPWYKETVPLLVPVVGNDSLYYYFGISTAPFAHKLQYLLLNTKLNKGKGGIVYPPPPLAYTYFTKLLDTTSVQLAGTSHCNKKDTWVATYYKQQFFAYLISSDGVSSTPVTSQVPVDFAMDDMYDGGNMRFSASGEKVLLPLQTEQALLIGDFNDRTGVFSNFYKLKIPAPQNLEDAELSPIGSKVYIGSYFFDGEPASKTYNVFQMDLSAGDPIAIEKTWTQVNPIADYDFCTKSKCIFNSRYFAQGLDGKIYVSSRNDKATCSVIEEPDQPGLQCNFKRNSFSFSHPFLTVSFNYIKSMGFTTGTNGIIAKKASCKVHPVRFSLLHQNIDSVKWNFGDPASGSANSASNPNPDHLFQDTGWYSISAIAYRACSTDTTNYPLYITADQPVIVPQGLHDTVLCKGQSLQLDVSSPNATDYLWLDNGSKKPVRKIDWAGDYTIVFKNACSTNNASFTVGIEKCSCDIYLPNAFSPNNDGINELFRVSTTCYLKELQIKIFNRFGQQVYQANDVKKGWDGRFGSEPQPEGFYVFTISYTDPGTQKKYFRKGTLLLSR